MSEADHRPWQSGQALTFTEMTDDERLSVLRLRGNRDFKVVEAYAKRIGDALNKNAIYAADEKVAMSLLSMLRLLDSMLARVAEASNPGRGDSNPGRQVDPLGGGAEAGRGSGEGGNG